MLFQTEEGCCFIPSKQEVRVLSPEIEKMLDHLIIAAESISNGRYDDLDRLFSMTDSGHYPEVVARFAEAFGMMAVQIQAREFRLEQIIDDLTVARDELSVSNDRLEKSMQDLQQAQMQLIQQEKMESVGRLAAGVAHEVKNPLAIIQLGIDFLGNELKDNKIWHETVEDMADAVQRADSVIKGLLDFSRSEQLEQKPADIAALVDDSLLLVRHELKSRHVVVSTEKDTDIPLLLLDRNKLKQVFINLFMNAAHAMQQDGGILTINLSKHTMTHEDLLSFSSGGENFGVGETTVMLKVSDTGTGISESAESKLFDPFFTTKPVGLGTGLGLSVTRKILELHNSVISLKNRTECRGAVVTIIFKI